MNLLDEARRIPGRYWVLAGSLSVLLLSFTAGASLRDRIQAVVFAYERGLVS